MKASQISESSENELSFKGIPFSEENPYLFKERVDAIIEQMLLMEDPAICELLNFELEKKGILEKISLESMKTLLACLGISPQYFENRLAFYRLSKEEKISKFKEKYFKPYWT